jgi:rRNA-processing protein FCF1
MSVVPIVIFDTSALMIPFQHHLDLERELKNLIGSYKAVVPSAVNRELETLSKLGKGKSRFYAKGAIDYLKQKDFKIVQAGGEADQAIFELAQQLNAITLTLDKELCRRLRRENMKVISIGKGKTLKFRGYLESINKI